MDSVLGLRARARKSFVTESRCLVHGPQDSQHGHRVWRIRKQLSTSCPFGNLGHRRRQLASADFGWLGHHIIQYYIWEGDAETVYYDYAFSYLGQKFQVDQDQVQESMHARILGTRWTLNGLPSSNGLLIMTRKGWMSDGMDSWSIMIVWRGQNVA